MVAWRNRPAAAARRERRSPRPRPRPHSSHFAGPEGQHCLWTDPSGAGAEPRPPVRPRTRPFPCGSVCRDVRERLHGGLRGPRPRGGLAAPRSRRRGRPADPARPRHVRRRCGAAADQRDGLTMTQTLPPKRLLVVDDDRAVRDALTKVLIQRGFTVVSAASGTEALEHLKGQRFTLMLLDVRMPPGPNGIELLPMALDLDPELPIIMLTAVSDLTTAARCMQAGARDFL